MRIAVPAETPGERRVAMTPQVVTRLVEERHTVVVESGAGAAAGFPDAEYTGAGAEVSASPYEGAEVVAIVGPPSVEQVASFPEGSVAIGFLEPYTRSDLLTALNERRITAFAMESIPRTTLAQSMDALSSQATAAGYHAVLAAAVATPRIFPMLTTAAGTISPVKLLVLGAGVAGLQAIATGRRLGASTSAYDIRPEVKEQIESLGARFVEAPVDESATSESGYAKEVTEETRRRQQEELAKVVAVSDVVITTAQIPGSAAPQLISKEMVETMRPGSVIVDVAAPTGGNCELTEPGETVEHNGVKILGPTDLPSRVAHDASQMYARNVSSLLGRMTGEEGELTLDFDDEIISGSCITREGEIVHPEVRRRLGLDGES
ncbi:MAG: Re/Si-specific NAD(P)(+) transhydrogenase subunit alpha [Actinomycetota bacterium]